MDITEEPTEDEIEEAKGFSEFIQMEFMQGDEDAGKFIKSCRRHTKEIWRVCGAMLELQDLGAFGKPVDETQFDLVFQKWGMPMALDIEKALIKESKPSLFKMKDMILMEDTMVMQRGREVDLNNIKHKTLFNKKELKKAMSLCDGDTVVILARLGKDDDGDVSIMGKDINIIRSLVLLKTVKETIDNAVVNLAKSIQQEMEK